jgi:hypothetical protein
MKNVIERVMLAVRAFQKLPALVRRIACFYGLGLMLPIGVELNRHGFPELGSDLLLAIFVAMVWSTGIYRYWKPLVTALLVILAIME